MPRYWTDLGLPVRPAQALKQADITSLAELGAMTDADLMRIPNFGEASLREVHALLIKHGYDREAPPRTFAEGVREVQAATRRLQSLYTAQTSWEERQLMVVLDSLARLLALRAPINIKDPED